VSELRERDFRAALDFVGEVHDAQSREEFRSVLLQGYRSLVPAEKTILTLSLASAGTVTVSDAGAKPKAKASALKAKPKLLKPSSATGGPGQAKVKLKLTGAAKATLEAKGKVGVKAKITFTPTGGTPSVQVRKLTVRAPKQPNNYCAQKVVARGRVVGEVRGSSSAASAIP
jgi:hypothetical protein